MKAFMGLAAIGVLTAFVWFLFFELDLTGGENVREQGSSFSPVPTPNVSNLDSESDKPLEETVEVYEEDEEIDGEDVEKPSPEDSLTPSGSVVERGRYLYYYGSSNYIVQARLVTVAEASTGLTETVKSDIPEAGALKIWRVVFEQSLYDGEQVYGDSTGLSRFRVSSADSEAYLLNTTGDYEGCRVSSLFGEDFADDNAVYSQCFIVAAESEPNLIFVGDSGSEFSTNPVIMD